MQHMNVVCVWGGGGGVFVQVFVLDICVVLCVHFCRFIHLHFLSVSIIVASFLSTAKKKQVNKGTKVFKCVVWGGLKP